ncbi:MAG: AAA family ATPase [Bacteroidetes bacterium]|nr:AAA family ATPase [Bacteroidota bacterium]
MDNKVKILGNFLDDFFTNISKIKNVDKGLAESLANLYNQGKLSDTNVKTNFQILEIKMPTKIKKISITGLRGVQETMELRCRKKSILLYGDNGTGKSSISDSLEWFFNDSVSHLAGQEIDLKDALRNANIADTDVSSVEIDFTKAAVNSSKTLSNKKVNWFLTIQTSQTTLMIL